MFDISPILVIGVGGVLTGLTVLVLLIETDLARATGLPFRQRLYLAGGIGLGILAFTLKLAIISGLTLAGARGERPFAVKTIAAPPRAEEPVAVIGAVKWEALPDTAPEPYTNPSTPEKVALGARLFDDPMLSRDGTVACISCHDTKRGAGVDGRPFSKGVGGQLGGRNAPTVFNAAFQAFQFWDGRAHSLEEQALGPIANPVEMGSTDLNAVVERLKADKSYVDAFAAAFGAENPVRIENVAKAIAAYERTLITPDAPYDRFVRGDQTALTQQQIRGMSLFESVGCADCHAGPNFSSASLLTADHGGTGFRLFPAQPTAFDQKYSLTADSGGRGKGQSPGLWRVPTLRNIALTGPYFHNGSVTGLTEAVRIMAVAQSGRVLSENPVLQPAVAWLPEERRLMRYKQTPVSEGEIADITAFLHALTSDRLAQAAKK
jgi:cytochrome c peroxidase